MFGFAVSGRALPSTMDILKMLAELREQREAIEQAIIVLERIAAGQASAGVGHRHGWPPQSGAAGRRADSRAYAGFARNASP